MAELGTVVALIKSMSGADPAVIEEAVADWLAAHPEATTTVQDGSITEAKLAQDVLADLAEVEELKEATAKITWVTPEQFGAVGDGETDDTEALQDAVDAGYELRLGSNKTYLTTEPITIDHDIKIVGGDKTLFKNYEYENGGSFFKVDGTLKDTTTLTTDYTTVGSSDNSGNRFTLSDMSNVKIGDILVITAEDQYYSYARQYYYLGGTLLVTDIYDGHIYTNNSLPFDITNSEDVTVAIYDAPQVTFENVGFESDVEDRRMYFRYAIDLRHCKNSTVRNCNINQMDMGIDVAECVNVHIDGVTMSKSKALNTIESDGYGICIASSTNTIVERVISLCAQACCCLTGTIPNINTYIHNCDLSAECRGSGIGLHENAYNTVIEDCTLGGAGLYGTVTMNRCRIIKNNRHGNDTNGIIFHGSHDERWAKIHIYDCELDGDKSDVGKCTTFSVKEPSPQNPVQNFACVVGEIIIRNCSGGTIKIDPEVGSGIESNTIKRLEIDHWDGCYEFYHTGECLIEYLGIKESRFVSRVWINKHSGDNFCYDNIRNLEFKSQYPAIDKQYASITKNGGSYVLPANVPITFASSDTSGHYMVCGRNLASNNPTDFGIGAVGGSTGEAITFTPNSDFANSLSANASGNLVISSPNKTSQVGVYAKCMLYVDKPSMARISCKLKNTGSTNGQGFRCYIAIVDCSTGKLTYKGNGSLITATAQGAIATHERSVPENSLVLCYLAMSGGGIANSQTTFEEYVIEVKDREFDSAVVYEAYNGSSRTGDGTLNSIEGRNNIMCSPASFSASFRVDKTDV